MPGLYPKEIHTANMPWSHAEPQQWQAPAVRPFITIAHEAGAEAEWLPQRLAHALDRRQPPLAPAWSQWGQELIEKVSQDSQIPAELIASLDHARHSWIDDALDAISGRADEMTIFRRLKETVRSLAKVGNTILVGHGSVCMTHDLPAGLHVRLVAPIKHRIKVISARFGLSTRMAEQYAHRMDKGQRAFFAKFWPNRPLGPEVFDAELNVAELNEDRLLQAIVAMTPEPGDPGAGMGMSDDTGEIV